MPGILAIWNDIEPEGYEHFERWYNREHLQERVGVPGFRFGRRYEAVSGGDRRFFAFYEVDSPAVLTSPAYHAAARESDALDAEGHALVPRHGAHGVRPAAKRGGSGGIVCGGAQSRSVHSRRRPLRMRWSMNWPRSPASRAFKSGRPPPARPRPIRQR